MSLNLRVLVIDDEVEIRNILRVQLSAQKYEIKEAATGAEGLWAAHDFHPHLIILDLGLPDKNGWEILKELRSWTKIPVIVLTVQDDEDSKVRLLDAGADDYLTKPFGAQELLARVRVSLRNHGQVEATAKFVSGTLEVDVNQRQLKVAGKIVRLTTTEFEVLALLVRDQGKVVPQSVIMKKVWGALASDQTHYLRIYINQLRKKMEDNPAQPVHILTEPGVGYRLV